MRGAVLGLSVVVLAGLLAALVVVPAGAQADEGTVLYIKGGDIWMTPPDGAEHAQVTEGGGWRSPTMADDGTIAAILDRRFLARMDRSGQPIGEPFEPPVVFTPGGIGSAQISPDGAFIVYWTIGSCNDGSGSVCETTQIVPADGSGSAVGGAPGARYPAWLPSGEVVVHDGVGADVVEVGQFQSQRWFGNTDIFAEEPYGPQDVEGFSTNRDGTHLALNGEYFTETDEDGEYPSGIWFHRMTGPYPAEPVLYEDCGLFDGPGEVSVGVSMDPFGTDIVSAVGQGEDSVSAESFSVVITDGFDPETCAGDLRVLVADAEDPFWSPVPFDGSVDPDPTPSPTPPGGGSTPPEPDEPLIELVDSGRVDGGGAADPVGQALATSQSIWADGGAPLVVLATADRFPDALAGSALAGEQGPVLVTPFGPDLDPRVRDEIARVTGGDGLVLILGGTAAVSDTAAAQARESAGAPTCPAPFPTDCRYAGTGREHTAALVGATVLALNDGSGGRALLARGDAFADAITGGAYAAEAGVPILLTPPTSLNPTTEAFIRDNGIGEVIVLGGTAAVDQPTMDAVPTTTRRIAGDDRTATAAAIATQLWQSEGLGGGGIVLVNVRHEDGWQAALAAAVLSALANAPQLGVENPPANPSPATLSAASALAGPVETHGSEDLVSEQQLAAVQDAAG